MSSTDTSKRRLNSLKTLTQELKESTTDSPFDIAHLKNLLQSARRHFQQKGTAQSDDKKTHQPRPKNSPHQINLKQSQYNNSRTMETNHLTEEIIQLRDENLKLQQKIQALKQKINLLQNQISKNEEKLNKQQPPYFKITDQLNVFICRLQISPSDCHKLEYFQYRGQLYLDKLKLVQKQKSIEQQFDLTTLLNVQYESDNILILQFQEFIEEGPSNPTSLFIKFGQKEHLHKWDLALFINFQIVNSLNKPKLFQLHFKLEKEERQKIKEQKKLAELRESKSLDESHQSDLLKLLIKRREQYLQIKKLVGQKMHHKLALGQQINNEIKNLTEEKDKENNQLTDQIKEKKQEKKVLVEKQEPIVQTPIHLISDIEKQYQPNNDFQSRFSRRTRQNIVSQNNEPNSGLPFFGVSFSQGPKGQFPLTSPPFNFSAAPQQQTLTTPRQDIRRQSNGGNNFTNIYARTQSFQQQSHGTFMSKVRQGPLKKVTTSIQNLQTGYFAIKYSKDGFNPHPKKVFLSLDCKKFCWSDPEKQSDYKSIPIEVIRKVSYPQIGQGVLKHVKNPDSRYFCIIEYLTSNYNTKTIQLGSGNLDDINNFYQDLELFRKSSKKLELNQ